MPVEEKFIGMISYYSMFWGTLEVMIYNPCLGGGTCVGGKKLLGKHNWAPICFVVNSRS
jgi:hypothetical protein